MSSSIFALIVKVYGEGKILGKNILDKDIQHTSLLYVHQTSFENCRCLQLTLIVSDEFVRLFVTFFLRLPCIIAFITHEEVNEQNPGIYLHLFVN